MLALPNTAVTLWKPVAHILHVVVSLSHPAVLENLCVRKASLLDMYPPGWAAPIRLKGNNALFHFDFEKHRCKPG